MHYISTGVTSTKSSGGGISIKSAPAALGIRATVTQVGGAVSTAQVVTLKTAPGQAKSRGANGGAEDNNPSYSEGNPSQDTVVTSGGDTIEVNPYS